MTRVIEALFGSPLRVPMPVAGGCVTWAMFKALA